MIMNQKNDLSTRGDKKEMEETHRVWEGVYRDSYTMDGRTHSSPSLSGIVHFAPAIEKPTFDQGFDALKMFSRLEGICSRTIVQGFYGVWKKK